MIRIKGILFLLLFAVVFLSSLFSSAQASGKKYTVCNNLDEHEDRPLTVVWSSSTQPNKGVCYQRLVQPGKKATYEFTKEQLKGEISVGVIIDYPETYPKGKVQVYSWDVADHHGRIINSLGQRVAIDDTDIEVREGADQDHQKVHEIIVSVTDIWGYGHGGYVPRVAVASLMG